MLNTENQAGTNADSEPKTIDTTSSHNNAKPIVSGLFPSVSEIELMAYRRIPVKEDVFGEDENRFERAEFIEGAKWMKKFLDRCTECNGTGEVEKNIWCGEEGMQIEMDLMVVCSECDGSGCMSQDGF